ncbi:hypothetical protein CERSUDRAFT_89135 [Gelatoporia subvermispora B]|uniref:DUF1479-domain-containing protein n=1 Tax=Ceriporiopsis subvermispora (strain B) TaxID=914234 RepID=M2QGW2_CERS8|nr:hypothetical protein CERSUDRAFT_89135 [Gelatoporia subvermispora B]
MAQPELGPTPSRFIDIKKDIAASIPDFEKHVTATWNDLLGELEKATAEIASQGSEIVPVVSFEELGNLSPERVDEIRRRGSVVIRDVVPDEEAASWKAWLQDYIKANPDVEGIPENDKQFFQLYWTKSQVRARAHPNVLAAQTWLNNLYHVRSGAKIENVDLSTPLTYADRFRIRHPGVQWDVHPPHIDSGSIERWEDLAFRECFGDILRGNWREHDPYDLENRMNARTSLYSRRGQSTVFRTFQGWLALSETAPHEGTLQVFPNVMLSNAYIILRPFFNLAPGAAEDSLDPKDWVFDISHPEFPGIYSMGTGFRGPLPKPKTHPHMKLEQTMVSVPKVNPGDMVFWHCDVVHAVEKEHTGTDDSAVMYIPAVPFTPANAEYVARQKETFIQGVPPPDFRQGKGETDFDGVGRPDDIADPIGKRAMGFAIEVA